jgi:hypothetical protein
MAIETFTELKKDVVRNPVQVSIGGVNYYGYQVSTYTINEVDAIKIGDNLEILIDQTWVYYLWSFELNSWTDVDNNPIAIIQVLHNETSNNSSTSIVNEGDVFINRTTVMRTGRSLAGEALYALLEESEAGSFLVWYYLDRSRFDGNERDIEFSEEGDDHTSNSVSVSVTYALIDIVSNTWLYLLYVVTIDQSGNVLQTQYLTEFGSVFIVGDLPLADHPIADQIAEVYSFKSENLVVPINFGDFIAGRELLAITLNITTPRTRKYGEGRSVLLLGSTVQLCPLGRKVLHYDRFSGHKIKTYPELQISNGSSCECDLLLSIPPTIVKRPATAVAM